MTASPTTSGTNFSPKHNSPSTFSAKPPSPPPFPLGNTSMTLSTMMPPCWAPWDAPFHATLLGLSQMPWFQHWTRSPPLPLFPTH
ncbi:hypothetical protein ACHAW6_014554 [Cyclotella cf. meneghiniana]